MRKWLVLIGLFLTLCLAQAQTDSLRLGFTVRGRVLDGDTGKPMESVHVSIPGRTQATVTNADGVFVLKSEREIREVVFSFLGYRTRRVNADGPLTVRMRRENLQLLESSIVTADPKMLVQTALENVWDSYCTRPELLECFYRETLQKRNRYTYVAEAVARLYKSNYDGTVYRDAAALEKSRVLVSQRRTDTLSVKTQGGPNQAISHDILKNNDIIFNKEDLPLYQYVMEMPAYIDDRLQFVIRMTPVVEVDYALYNVRLYIDRELLTFTRIEASLDMRSPSKATKMLLVRKPLGLRFFPEEATIVLNYRQLEGGLCRLEYFRATMRFACDWRKRLFKTRYTAVNELVITDVRPEATPISREERFKLRDFLPDKAPEFYDPDFWKDYNIIEPSESLEHAIGRLKRGQ